MADKESSRDLKYSASSDVSGNEIDEFTAKLLDKKAEMALFPDDDDITSSALEGTMSEAQRKTAESTMLSALDALRKERGQQTIEEEEESYRRTHAPESVKETVVVEEEEEYIPVEPNRYETKHREDHFEKAEARPEPKHFWQKSKFWIWTGMFALLAALFAGYVWKVTVYDPAHIATEDQSDAYNRLVNFADEYSMMSDAQKKDITRLEEDYNSLPEAKKQEINEYFENPKHTGRSFTDLLAQARQGELLAANPGLQELLDYSNGYASMDDAARNDIINRIDAYNALSDEAKAQVDAAMQASAGMNFLERATQTQNELNAAAAQAASLQAAADAAAAAQQEADAQKAELQAQLDSLQADRDNYVYFLQSEGMATDGDDILAQYDAQIADLQAQIAGN